MFREYLKFLRRLFASKIFKEILLVIITYIVLNILSGLIGNTAYTGSVPIWFYPTWENIRIFFALNLLTITSITSGISLIMIFLLGYRSLNLSKLLGANVSMNDLDDSLLRLLANFINEHEKKSKEVLQKEYRRLLYELLRDATRTVLGNKNKGRAAVFLPDTETFFPNSSVSSGEYLRILAYHRLSPETIARTKFYIGNDDTKEYERGTVGTTYLEKHIRIANFTQSSSTWECSDDSYVNFDEHRSQLPYKTLVNIPIIGPSKISEQTCMGVLGIDTKLSGAFELDQSKVFLEAISRRIAVVTTIYLSFVQKS